MVMVIEANFQWREASLYYISKLLTSKKEAAFEVVQHSASDICQVNFFYPQKKLRMLLNNE